MIPAHYIAHNKVTRLPRCFVYLDTEAWQKRHGKRETQTFRLAAAVHDCTRKDRPHLSTRESQTFDDTSSLWEWIGARCRKGHRTVLVCHNLAYDVRISEALVHLPKAGWKLKAARLDRGQAWAILSNGTRSLWMVDSVAWMPAPLKTIGDMVGRPKPPLPENRASKRQWLERCQADAEILATAWRRVMAWLEAEDLGTFKLTGAGQSWAAYRHRFITHPILVHNDHELRAREREAGWTGRCEAWRWGELPRGQWHEWDLTRCYATIAQECMVPVRFITQSGKLSQTQRIALHKRGAVLHRCQVTTDTPLVPAKGPHGVIWPVGTFETTLWDTEVKLLVTHGAKVRTLDSWLYRRTPALKAWADWVLGELEKGPTDLDPVIRLVLKHWSRALIGRFAARTTSWEYFGEANDFDVVLGLMTPEKEGVRRQLLQLGYECYTGTQEREGADAAPMVLSWIMAEARVRLWRTMETAGLDHVAYCDTDGLIVDEEGHARLRAARLPGLRVKRSFRTGVVLGPRQLLVGGELRASGVPRAATRDRDGQYTAEWWQSLSQSLSRGEPGSVEVVTRKVKLRGVDNRRRHLDDGTTEALEVG